MVTVWNALVYTVGLYLLGISLWKSVVVALAASIAIALQYGTRWLMRIGVAVMIMAGAVWIEVLPPPAHWLQSASKAYGDLVSLHRN